MQITINNVLKSEETTCTGDAVTTVFGTWANRTSSVILHNAGSNNIWYRVQGKDATAPTTSTLSSTKKFGVVAPGETITIAMDCLGVKLYIINDTGASTTCNYCAYALDGTTI